MTTASPLPSAEDIQEAETALAQLKRAAAQLDAAIAAREAADAQQAAVVAAARAEGAAAAQEAGTVAVRYPKKKCAIFLAYNGHGYSVRCPLVRR